MTKHIMRVTNRSDPDFAMAYLYTGSCSCGFDCKFETSIKKHVDDVLYEHAMSVADMTKKKTGFR